MSGVGKNFEDSIDEVLMEFGYLGIRELDKAGREERERKSASTLRLRMALFGAIALIVPMLIMALHPARKTALITTSIVTIVFAIITAFSASDSSGKDVLIVTAAYAAVFVVFVGSSLSAAQPPS
jgi:VIT1/CCC1 family predicted Fe2+/Mn2+ transporter